MDKSWMDLRGRHLPRYVKRIKDFIEFARAFANGRNMTRCPCMRCNNRDYMHIDEAKELLLLHGMDKRYTCWEFHEEHRHVRVVFEDEEEDDDDDFGDNVGVGYEGLPQMLKNLQGATTRASSHRSDTGQSEAFESLLRESRQSLYPGCDKFSKLDFLVKLLHIKTINRWSNKSFNMVIKLIKTTLPTGETLPKSYYEAKIILRDLGLGYILIRACKNNCMLFWKETEQCMECTVCHKTRYKLNEGKSKTILHKVLRYFFLKPRLQRLYMSQKTAEDMRWHKEKRVTEENVCRHPTDSQTWAKFDTNHEWFANKPRDVRLGLASDGFNPFGDMSNAYSMWPVLLVPYNLPSWKCMKEPFIFMSLLIPGLKSSGNEIDMYLRPLMGELKELWRVGVEAYNVYKNETFQFHTALLWTINDFSTYENLSGLSIKGYQACPVYSKDVCSLHLSNGKKICYMCHRHFLPPSHGWRNRQKHLFDGKIERRLSPSLLSGKDVLAQLALIQPVRFGKISGTKKRKRTNVELNWTKKSIFFDFSYSETLKLRHNLDVMHIEKNICDNVLETLMNIEGKTNDTVKARLDLQELGIQKELHLIHSGDKYIVPLAQYRLARIMALG